MKAISTPPLASGPPSAVHLRPFFWIQASNWSLASCVRRRSGGATPCRMLWLFFVVRNTAGDGLGTYLVTGLSLRVQMKLVNVPSSVHIQGSQEPDQRMSHQSNPATLWCAREKPNLYLLFPQLVGKLCHSSPRPGADGLLIIFQIIQQMDLATCIDSDLITGADGETRVIVGAEEHQTLARSRVCLFIQGADDRQLRLDLGRISNEKIRCLALVICGRVLPAGNE